ncbi:MAG TPA: hypothetical protein ENO00_05425 [Deltaproteobacteria bacterium]|nr:hypothetical protein [Deltaproteobacteria bacterium]
MKLENTVDYRMFVHRNTIIWDFIGEPGGMYVQGMLSESMGRMGRIDVSHERIENAHREHVEDKIVSMS